MYRSRLASLCEEDVLKKVRKQRVIVERYAFSDERNVVTGTVRVANLAFEKKVQVCYTFNDWNSRSDLNLIWEGSVGVLRETDKFGMVIPLPVGWSGRVEFFIRYEVNGQTYFDSNDDKKYEIAASSTDKPEVANPMALCEEDILRRVRKQGVFVEKYDLSEGNDAVSGRVRVANVSFEKKVRIRYTFNAWNSHFDQNLIWEGSVGVLGETDKFTLVIPLPARRWSGCVEFAIRYEVSGQCFWDNNSFKNYRVNITNRDNS